jgi:predicted membrane chloride channel (bestrophin family)
MFIFYITAIVLVFVFCIAAVLELYLSHREDNGWEMYLEERRRWEQLWEEKNKIYDELRKCKNSKENQFDT